VLVPFGGGGPLHGCGLAELLGMRRVLVPPFAGVLSAVGLALTAERREAMLSLVGSGRSTAADALRVAAAELVARVPAPGDWARATWVRARYAGQGHELDVPLAPDDETRDVAARFAALHQRRFGFTLDRPLELVSARHAAAGGQRDATFAREGRAAWSADAPVDTGSVLEATLRGAISIALPDATLLVAEGWTARALAIGGWMLERDA
jgi:N-methylhydantoinase A